MYCAPKLQKAIEQSIILLRWWLRYPHAFGIQANYTALANARRSIEDRLARWLRMASDRLDSDEIALTHEFHRDLIL